MIPKECKRLAEVDFPIAVVSAHSAREKSIRHGHPSTLHLWWARRPLAACRAMLLALLLPDPCDENCPAAFKDEARRLLGGFPAIVPDQDDLSLRRAILHFIGDFANWDNAAKPRYLEVGRGLVKAAHGDEAPLVVDPFAGGGSIPLEALRLGCEAFASDLNPVACLILKVMLEDIPRHGPELADELRKVGAEIKKQAEKELAQYYPADPDGATPIAYLWARTVRCESPNCGAEIPLMRSFWLCKKSSRLRALRAKALKPKDETPQVYFEVFTPKSEKEVPKGTVARGNATCPACERVLPVERVRVQLREQRGGADVIFDAKGGRVGGARLLAAVVHRDSEGDRDYRPEARDDYRAVWKAQQAVLKLGAKVSGSGMCPIPDESLPNQNTLGLRLPNYGFKTWGDLFSSRQKLSLCTLANAVNRMPCDEPGAQATQRLLALAVSRTADYCSANCSLHAGRDVVRNTWARNALPIVWDYYESVPWKVSSGSFGGALDWVSKVTELLSRSRLRPGQVTLADASESPLPSDSADIWFTDPPYYNAIGYAESSDFFLVWLKRALRFDTLQDPFDLNNPLSPKIRENIQDDTFESIGGACKDRRFFENRMAEVFASGRELLRADGAACAVFAHKTTEGWEALLGGIIRGGWIITASWPIETEMKNKMSGQQSGESKAMLLASVHLVCRPRPEDAEIGDWADVLRELPKRIGDWMERLSSEGVRGADLIFACIGPAIEVYSRYSKVEDAEGRDIPLGGDPEATEPYKRGFLAYVWEIVGRTALGQVLGTAEARARNGAAGALEEDARLTALFLWTHQSTAPNGANAVPNDDTDDTAGDDDDNDEVSSGGAKKGLTLIYDVVRRFSQPLGIHLDTWNDRIIETKKGIVRLLPVKERARHLLGEDGASGVADMIERNRGGPINLQFAFMNTERRAPRANGKARKRKSTADEAPTAAPGATTLDRVHIAMLLQAGGKSNALRTMLKAEQERGPDFLRLANALSALYPRDSEEKRLLDAMLLAVPR